MSVVVSDIAHRARRRQREHALDADLIERGVQAQELQLLSLRGKFELRCLLVGRDQL